MGAKKEANPPNTRRKTEKERKKENLKIWRQHQKENNARKNGCKKQAAQEKHITGYIPSEPPRGHVQAVKNMASTSSP